MTVRIEIKMIEPSTIERIQKWVGAHKNSLRKSALTAIAASSLAGASSEPSAYGIFPDYSHHGQALNRIALQLKREGKQDSFEQVGDFTREHFEQARKGILLVETLDERGNWINNFTGWVVSVDKEKLKVAIKRHGIVSDRAIETFRTWRPGIDKAPQTFLFDSTRIVSDVENDHGILEFTIDPSQPVDYVPLPYLDQYVPPPATDVLVIGYPGAFAYPADADSDLPWKNFVYGKVISIKNSHPDNPIWSSEEVINKGISSAPTILILNGVLTVIGQVHANYEPIPPGKYVNIPVGKPPTILFSTLNVDTLLGKLR